MSDTEHLPSPDVLRRIGKDLQEALRASGVELPGDMAPEEVARAMFDHLRQELEEWGPVHERIWREVRAELGPSASHQELAARARERTKEWWAQHDAGSEPTASA